MNTLPASRLERAMVRVVLVAISLIVLPLMLLAALVLGAVVAVRRLADRVRHGPRPEAARRNVRVRDSGAAG